MTDEEFERLRVRVRRTVIGTALVALVVNTAALATLAARHTLTPVLAINLGLATLGNAIALGIFLRAQGWQW